MFRRRSAGLHQVKQTETDTEAHMAKGGSEMSLKSFAETIRSWHRRRVCIRELAQLTDRELADLGIHRSEIAAVVRKTPGM